MLKKNIRCPSSQPHLENTVAVQTEEFLLYLSIQDKLSNLLEEYKALEEQNKQRQNLLEYYEFKNTILENSLHELTFAFNNKMTYQKIDLIDEIAELDKIIEKEQGEIQYIQSMVVSEICYENKSKVSEDDKNKEKNMKLDKCKQRDHTKPISLVMAKKKRESADLFVQQSQVQQSSRTMRESQNQFLELQQKCFNVQERSQSCSIPNKTLKKKRNEPQKRSVDKKKCSSTKVSREVAEKENNFLEVMSKRQAQLNLKAFLTSFQYSDSDRIRKKIH